MVKGISRQVIVVHGPKTELFDQAIFILKDGAVGEAGITDEALLKEAKQALRSSRSVRKLPLYYYGPVWAAVGALVTGIAWAVSALV